jgi:hypothetical protein
VVGTAGTVFSGPQRFAVRFGPEPANGGEDDIPF